MAFLGTKNVNDPSSRMSLQFGYLEKFSFWRLPDRSWTSVFLCCLSPGPKDDGLLRVSDWTVVDSEMQSSTLFIIAFVQIVVSSIPRNGPCIPGELVWVDCNLCTCNQRGMPNFVCATMWCQVQPKGGDHRMTTETYYDDEAENVENNEAS
ncbi:hypothetical protein GE061_015289 [Apolygus lucorum]|uniref:Uncharacterized protein n=1 Tax=Apolygus lucorum TaxID=248454 RepID=A0A6A4JKC8_APOLU|nr:hypothetical protein GE061_015289 [Apolygus lucorum]